MSEIIISIVIGIVSAVVYDVIKKALENKYYATEAVNKKYTSSYINKVRKQFYICFFGGLTLLLIPITDQFLGIFKNILTSYLLFFALSAFMCAMDVIDHMSKNRSDDRADN